MEDEGQVEQRAQKLKQLTSRQLEVLEERCKGKSRAEIADALFIQEGTVQFHFDNIYARLELDHLSQAARNLEIPKFCEALKYVTKEDIAQPEPEPEPEAPQPASFARRQAVRNLVILFLTIIAVIVLASAGIKTLIFGPPIGVLETVQPRQATSTSGALYPTTTTTAVPTVTPLTPVASTQPSPTVAATPSSTAPDLASEGVCGETAQMEAPLASRFIRNQGVSAFTVENTEGAVLSNRVRALAIDARGLWIGYHATDQLPINGLGHYDKSLWFDCDHSEATAGNVNAVAIDHTGQVWIATEKDGVAMFDGKSWRRFTIRNGLPSDWTYGITIDENNNVWVATWEGIAKFDGDLWSVPYSVHNKTLYNNHTHAIAFDSSHNIWIGHIDYGVSLYRSTDGSWIYHTAETSGLGGNRVHTIVVRPPDADSAESIWFATGDGGVSKFEQGEWTVYGVDDGLPSNDVLTVALDKYNRVWAATMGGVAYFDDQEWTIYDTIGTFSVAFGPSCQDCPFDDEHIWTGTANLGLTHSHIPYPDTAIDIIEVCFVSAGRERICPSLTGITKTRGAQVISVTYPITVTPGEEFRFEIVAAPRSPYQLREGDFLSNMDENDANLFGAYQLIPVEGTIEPGQPFTFTDHDNPLIAPQLADGEQERTFTTRWRVWMRTRYAGPAIHISFTVQRP